MCHFLNLKSKTITNINFRALMNYLNLNNRQKKLDNSSIDIE
jgi:uncharacterized membrane protein